MPRFVQKLLDGDGDVWVSWLMPTRVGVRESAHTFCVVYKRNSPHTYVWAKQVMPTHLFFFLLNPLTRVRVGEVDNAHTPVCQASYPSGPARDA